MNTAIGGAMKSKYLNLLEAAEYTGMGVSTLRRKIKLGVLTAYKPGKFVLIDPVDLEKFIRKSRQQAS